jgi:hypothetical protein
MQVARLFAPGPAFSGATAAGTSTPDPLSPVQIRRIRYTHRALARTASEEASQDRHQVLHVDERGARCDTDRPDFTPSRS